MFRRISAAAIISIASSIAQSLHAEQKPSWQDLAIQQQMNTLQDQAVSNAIIAALQAEIADLKAQLAKAQQAPKDPPPSVLPRPEK
jgi:uncharacterized small protein (DUF1192 family)